MVISRVQDKDTCNQRTLRKHSRQFPYHTPSADMWIYPGDQLSQACQVRRWSCGMLVHDVNQPNGAWAHALLPSSHASHVLGKPCRACWDRSVRGPSNVEGRRSTFLSASITTGTNRRPGSAVSRGPKIMHCAFHLRRILVHSTLETILYPISTRLQPIDTLDRLIALRKPITACD